MDASMLRNEQVKSKSKMDHLGNSKYRGSGLILTGKSIETFMYSLFNAQQKAADRQDSL
jgi:hypothetical protein